MEKSAMEVKRLLKMYIYLSWNLGIKLEEKGAWKDCF